MHLLIQQKYRILQAESGIKDTFGKKNNYIYSVI